MTREMICGEKLFFGWDDKINGPDNIKAEFRQAKPLQPSACPPIFTASFQFSA
jgi:hypothetical protein